MSVRMRVYVFMRVNIRAGCGYILSMCTNPIMQTCGGEFV